MGPKGNYRDRKFKNDLEKDPDFDLDAYLEEQSNPNHDFHYSDPQADEEDSRSKNGFLIIALVLASVLWYYDWSPANAWNSIFGGNDTATASEVNVAPDINVNIPEIEIPDMPDLPPMPALPQQITAPPLDMSLTEYLTELKELGFLDDEISTFSARQLYDGNIPVSYLQELNEAEYLEDFSFVDITNYYNNQIPFSYLDQLSEAGLLDELSFVDVTNFYHQDVSIEYLQELDRADYLEELSFVDITNYYENGVTVEFLDQLKETGLYEDLNFLDVIDLYRRENANAGQ